MFKVYMTEIDVIPQQYIYLCVGWVGEDTLLGLVWGWVERVHPSRVPPSAIVKEPVLSGMFRDGTIIHKLYICEIILVITKNNDKFSLFSYLFSR